ncbi:MAG: hypothetical protein FJ358_08380 [Thaumarchaeota archaeon]|nr:hypothetical protein [Nitrososphaerota archaeon]
MLAYSKALKAFCKHNHLDLSQFHILGFDSFQGLPEKQNPADDHPHWKQGNSAAGIPEIMEKLRKAGIDPGWRTVHLVKGWFKESLTLELREELKKWPPAIVTIVVDYYSSAKIVLE